MLCDTKPNSPLYRCYYGYLDVCDTTTRKTRNLSEKKRRDQFNMLINELCSMVSTNNRKMDKSTVLKSTIAFLKNYQEISVQSQAHEIKENWKPSFLSNDEFTQLMLEALDSFLLVFSQDGTILYASESITSLLGHLPGDVVNRSIFDLIHSEEKMQLYNVIASHSSGDNKETEISDTGGHKFSLTCHIKRGLLLPSDQQIYELVKLAGNVRLWNGDLSVDSDVESNYKASDIFSPAPADTVCFCCTVRLETSQLIREMSMVDDIQTQFTSKHSMEWKFLFLDHRAPPIIGYLPFELLGTSGYDYYHPDDLEKISNCHEQLMATGEGKSCPYRFLTKGQQWIWLKTRFFITYHQWNCKPEFIVCTHQLISYSDVRSQLRKTDGDEESHSSRCCSPSSYSVTSAGQAESKWSATSSQRSDSPDRSVTGHLKYESEAPQKPHSTAQLSPHTVISSEASPHTSQQPLQGILVPPNIFVHTASTRQSPPQELTPIVCQSPSSTVTNQAHSTSPVVHPPASPLVSPQVYLTPAQHQLHKQLQEKSQILQQAILQQQAELHQINSQLALSQTMPVQVQHSSPAPETTGTLMLGTSPSFPQYSSLPTFNRVAQTPSPVTQSEPLQQQQQQINNHHQQQQYFPFQFVQPQPMYSPLNSLSHPNNLPK